MYINVVSPQLGRMEMTDYTERYIADRFAVIPGVANASVFGARPAMRVWIDRLALAARNLTVIDVEAALRRENIELPRAALRRSIANSPCVLRAASRLRTTSGNSSSCVATTVTSCA